MKAAQLNDTIRELIETRDAVREVKERLKKHSIIYGESSLIPARTTFMVNELEVNITTILDALESAQKALSKADKD